MTIKRSNRTAIFGGSFDPIHHGHIYPVIEAADAFGIDKLIYLPCYKQPLKAFSSTDSRHRLKMCQLAVSELPTDITVEVSSYEIDEQGTSYTLKTLKHFQQQLPDTQLYLVIGMDSLLNFHRWHHWQKIIELSQLIVLTRPNYSLDTNAIPLEIADYLGTRIHFIESTQIDVSSTDIRAAFLSKQSQVIESVMPLEVIDYIKNHKLYQD